MASEDGEKQNPFTRPGFIAAAGVVALIAVCAIIIVIVNLSRENPELSPTSTTAPTGTMVPSTPIASGDESVCGLDGVELSGSVTSAPAATWAYEGTTAYPTSPVYGPGETASEGYRYCFQHSPTGALFAAANAVPHAGGENRAVWLNYILAPGTYRDQLLSQETASDSAGTRTTIVGFRLLSYDGDAASVDLAVTVSTDSGTATLSSVYSLVWADGDWKLNTSTDSPIDVASIPNVAGYTPWGEG